MTLASDPADRTPNRRPGRSGVLTPVVWMWLVSCAVCIVGGTAFAEDGVSDGKIVFGQVAALQGPARALGQGMRQGILAAFEAANRGGGIFGRTLELKSLDDGYEPEKTIEATKRLIDEDKVFALVGAVGTPTSKAGQPIATAAKKATGHSGRLRMTMATRSPFVTPSFIRAAASVATAR